jgi:hypothetical protein
MRASSSAPTVMPAEAGIHDFASVFAAKSWMPASAGMTVGAA